MLREREKALLEILSENKNLTAQNIADDIGKSISTIKRELKALKDKGLMGVCAAISRAIGKL
jgi:DeoR/GlpR family transcriptional regulator of sugar metabolism